MLFEVDMAPELAAILRPRVQRLGYLVELFRYTAHQPKALMSFVDFTEDLSVRHAVIPNALNLAPARALDSRE